MPAQIFDLSFFRVYIDSPVYHCLKGPRFNFLDGLLTEKSVENTEKQGPYREPSHPYMSVLPCYQSQKQKYNNLTGCSENTKDSVSKLLQRGTKTINLRVKLVTVYK